MNVGYKEVVIEDFLNKEIPETVNAMSDKHFNHFIKSILGSDMEWYKPYHTREEVTNYLVNETKNRFFKGSNEMLDKIIGYFAAFYEYKGNAV